ncbi:MAG: glycerol-3-phosphate responsive antiterminator [Lentisphaeria bacterium]
MTTDSIKLSSQTLIAAVRSHQSLETAIQSPIKTIFLLAGNIETLADECTLLRDSGKQIFLHLDLIEGLKGDTAGIRFIAKHIRPHGVISTKSACLRIAKSLNLLTILRVFLLDSLALETGTQHIRAAQPDFVEIMPGVAPTIISLAVKHFALPIIAGGLIHTSIEAERVLEAGAAAVSTSSTDLWNVVPR